MYTVFFIRTYNYKNTKVLKGPKVKNAARLNKLKAFKKHMITVFNWLVDLH